MSLKLRKIFFVLLCMIVLVGCDNNIDGNNNNADTGITDNNDNNIENNNENEEKETNDSINTVGLSGYLISESNDRYFGFTNELNETLTKEFNFDSISYKFTVKLTNIENDLKYSIYFNDKLLDTINFESDYPDDKNIDLFILDGGYVVFGYHNSYINIYDLNNSKLVENMKIVRDFTSIENRFILKNQSLSFVDISKCEPEKVTIEVNLENIKIIRNATTTAELNDEGYQIAGAVC